MAALHHSSWKLPSFQVAWSIFHSISFLSSFSFSFFYYAFYNFISICLFVLHFFIRSSSCFLPSYVILIFTPHHCHHLILWFSLCPLEVNFHTYLTTWLSSCLVGIFFGFLTIIVNPKFINKRVTHKMCNLKINSYHVVFRVWLSHAYLFWVDFLL